MKNNSQNPLTVLQGNTRQKMQLTSAYLQMRAQREGVDWNLTNDYLSNQFDSGVRNFFGLQLNELCFPLYDHQEFERGDLNQFICWYLNAGYSIKN